MLNIDKAKQELSEKSLNDIQTDTAWTWASRAAASFERSSEEQGIGKLAWFTVGEEYFHEALEHAALITDDDIIGQVREAVIPFQEDAARLIDEAFENGQSQNNYGNESGESLVRNESPGK